MFNIDRKITVPTGEIFTGSDEHGHPVECLWVRDYGKDANLKADFLGLEENIQVVEHTECLSVHEKLVTTVSSQNGCSMNCVFCDVPKVGKGTNISLETIHDQVDKMINHAMPDAVHGKRLNIHYARMGEPTFNRNILKHAIDIKVQNKYSSFDTVHPVISTMMPRKNKELYNYLTNWMDIKNSLYFGDAGLQLSINSTNDTEREDMFNNSSLPFDEVGKLAQRVVLEKCVVGRKVTLNFALAGYEIDVDKLLKYFDPEFFLCKLTPMHVTESVVDNKVSFIEPYEAIEEKLKSAGYDVIVFIPSHEEDMGRITCGNAILSGSNPEVRFSETIYDGINPK